MLLKTGVPFAKTPQIPKVVLLGNEKSGKSSLLEKLFGSLVYIKDQKIDRPVHVETCHVDGLDSWFELEDLKGSRFLTGEDLGTELIRTAATLGFTETEILESPIKVKLNSFDLCGDITFVDFPGVKNSDNWNSFREFVMREFDYSSDCILIGVVPVTDPNNQARVLKLLGDLDSHRVRSSLILTKLDLVSVDDIQTFLDSYLSTFPQVVGIGNMDDAINQKEVLCVDKFNNKIHAAIPKFAPYENHIGLRAARVMISNLIAKTVRKSVTDIRDKLQKQMFTLQRNCFEIKAITSVRSDISVSTLVKTFGDSLNKALFGCASSSSEPKEESIDLTEGARINMIFQKTLVNLLRNINSVFNENDNRQVVYAIKNSRAIRTGFFIPDKAFNTVARQRIERFRLPLMNCLKDIVVQVKGAIARCGRLTLQSYPVLMDEITRKCVEFVLTNDMLVQDAIDAALKIEECYINSANEDFAKQVERANALAEDGHSFKVKRSIMSTNLNKSGPLSILQPETNTKHKFWFVLSSDELQWFKHKDKKTFVACLKLDNLRLMDGDVEGSICMFYLTGLHISDEDCKKNQLERSWVLQWHY